MASQKSARLEEESARQAAVRREGAILGQMTEARGGAVSGSNVGAILSLQVQHHAFLQNKALSLNLIIFFAE